MREYFKLAEKNLKNQKLRSVLTLLGIVISIMVIFVLITLSLGLREGVEDVFDSMGRDKFFLYPRGIPGLVSDVTLTTQDLNTLKRVSGIEKTFYMSTDTGKISFKDEIRYYFIVGIPLENSEDLTIVMDLFNLEIENGQYFKQREKGKVVLGYKYLDIFPGIIPGDRIELVNETFRVIGILESVGNDADDKQVYINYEDAKRLFNFGDEIDVIGAQVNDVSKMDEIIEALEKKLDKSRGVNDDTRDYILQTPEDLLSTFNTILIVITAFLVGVGGISIFVGGVGIANTMYTSVTERTKEIGIMKAIGAKNNSILTIFLMEAGILGLIGGAIGMLLGFGVSELVGYLAVNFAGTTYLQPVYPMWLIIGLLFFSVLIGIIGGILPSKNASKAVIVKALRYE